MNRIYCSGLTHPGRVRRKNEDSFCIFCPEDRRCTFAAVADGIGGHDKGEIASELCCSMLLERCMQQSSFLDMSDPEQQLRSLSAILAEINERITQLSSLRDQRPPMGTTVCAAIFSPEYVTAAYAGDSRLYELTDSDLLQRTNDQTLGEFIRTHQYAAPEPDDSPDITNVITNALGIFSDMTPATLILPRKAGHQYLLCSDGLHHVLPKRQIMTVLQEAINRQTAEEHLLKKVLQGGAPDNVTIVIGSEAPLKQPAQKGIVLC